MRLTLPDRKNLTSEQKRVIDNIAASRSGTLAGPFAAWLHAPLAADFAQKLGAHLRYKTSLPEEVTETVILTVASCCDCMLERLVHEPIARRAGVPEELIRALENGTDIQPSDPLSLAVVSTKQIVEKHYLEDTVFEACLSAFGEEGVVELFLVVGYYVAVAITINAFEIKEEDTVPI